MVLGHFLMFFCAFERSGFFALRQRSSLARVEDGRDSILTAGFFRRFLIVAETIGGKCWVNVAAARVIRARSRRLNVRWFSIRRPTRPDRPSVFAINGAVRFFRKTSFSRNIDGQKVAIDGLNTGRQNRLSRGLVSVRLTASVSVGFDNGQSDGYFAANGYATTAWRGN